MERRVVYCRYKPMKPIQLGGIIIVKDRRPEEKEELVAMVR